MTKKEKENFTKVYSNAQEDYDRYGAQFEDTEDERFMYWREECRGVLRALHEIAPKLAEEISFKYWEEKRNV